MSVDAATRLKGNLRSIQAMLVAVVLFSIMDTTMKLLAAQFPPMQVAALRSLASLPLVCAYVAWRVTCRSWPRGHHHRQRLVPDTPRNGACRGGTSLKRGVPATAGQGGSGGERRPGL